MQNKLARNYCENSRERFKNNAYKPSLPTAYMSFHRACWNHIAEKKYFFTWPEYNLLENNLT